LKSSVDKYLHNKLFVPAGNSIGPVISSIFLRWGPALTGTILGGEGAATGFLS
jgi:hypothetical protein